MAAVMSAGFLDGGVPLRRVGAPRQLAAGASSVNTALTPSCQAITMRAVGADIRYMIGDVPQTASASTSHLIANGERMDVAVPGGANIAVIRAAGTSGTLEMTELL